MTVISSKVEPRTERAGQVSLKTLITPVAPNHAPLNKRASFIEHEGDSLFGSNFGSNKLSLIGEFAGAREPRTIEVPIEDSLMNPKEKLKRVQDLIGKACLAAQAFGYKEQS